MSKPKQNLLVIRLSAMGDVAMTVPVLRALNTQFPGVEITVLTREFFTPFFRDLQNIRLVSAEVKGRHKGVIGLYKLAQELNKTLFYGVADLHNVLRSKILRNFITCDHLAVIDKGRKEKRLLTSGKLFTPLKSTHERYADVFQTLGFNVDLSNPKFPAPVVLNNDIKTLLRIYSKEIIGIAPFAAHEGKVYPLDLMEEVISELSKVYTIILFGGGEHEVNTLKNLEQKFQNTVSIVGKLSLEAQLDVISNLDVMLSMDSGNAHIAAMLGVKVVTIWGVTHPYAGFAPFNQPDDYALLPDRTKFPLTPTSIYGNKYPKSYKNAAGSISPTTIIDKINTILKPL
ncbi:glycosyltransferase family 9 protein [Algibacter mikhailovii]|uniref:glycosyltransferase family 9 protein n=1 Tax=Algibacter mikhailovii TaxID=425498 RepID=UPI0024958809|nr:glycosyltransferase family 9 protein [Algibacter mikhailovii]